MIIAVDFDGTIVDHRYPDIGAPVPGALRWLAEFQAAGAQLILYTMRSDNEKHGPTLSQAVEYCKSNGIEFWGVNENPEQKSWTTSPKVYAHRYIDDAAAGCPLLENIRDGGRPYVNWHAIGPAIMKLLEK